MKLNMVNKNVWKVRRLIVKGKKKKLKLKM